MSRVARVVGLLALGLASAVRAEMPDATSFIAEVVAQRIDPATFDFARAGFWDLDEHQRGEWNWKLIAVMSNPDGDVNPAALIPAVLDPAESCETAAQRRYSAMAWATVATKSKDAAEWKRAQAELVARRAKLDARMAAAASGVSDRSPALSELLQRAARDRTLHEAMNDETWSMGMPRSAQFAWYSVIRTVMLTEVCANADWLKAQVTKSGWFDARTAGRAADEAAWQLLARAERDREFQSETLALLRKLPPEATSQLQLAFLDDELAFQERRGQRFGTKRFCRHDGSSLMRPDLEDPAHVNERRARVGLEPIDPAPLAKDPNCPLPGY